jgi:hypothetical protein
MIPKVSITLEKGTLGASNASDDAVIGMVIGCDPATSGIAAGTILVLNSIDDAKTAKLDLIPYAYQQIQEFYNEAGTGVKLYVLICANTETFANMADAASVNAYGKKLLDYAGGKITLLGICRKPAAGYTPTVTKGLDDDVIAAAVKMQALAEAYLAKFTPFVGIIEGRNYLGVAATLEDMSVASHNFVGITLAASDELHAIDGMAASVGLVLGRAAAVPVQRKIARVKDGALSVTGVYYGATTLENTDVDSIAEKAYIVIGIYANKTGYYFYDDTLATDQTEDYRTISLRRVMNKLVRLVYQTFIEELNDDIELTSAGKLTPAVAKSYQGKIDNVVNNNMTSNGELSSFKSYVDQDQNVLTTSKIAIKLKVVPKGYAQEIDVTLGFATSLTE